ncbi:Lsr2 family protein [Nocardiopsis sp. CNT-189]|uniref:Lsr2 family DNA-binding protein n=1 Tax=Nocardiopsis oceanisediminis TaxID=2816862 RepID=UPI003B306668
MSDLLVARTSAVIHVGRRRVRIRRGDTVVNADDPIVAGREHMFEPLRVPYLGAAAPAIERATADPGERRTVEVFVEQADPEPEPQNEQEGPGPGGGEVAVEPSAKEVREWAKASGLDVPARGKLPEDLVAAYKRAHGEGW